MSEPNLSKDPRSDAGTSAYPSDPVDGLFSPYRQGPSAYDHEPAPLAQSPTYDGPRYDQPAQAATPGGSSYPGVRPTNGMAVASLIASIGGWTLVPVIGWVLGIIFGHIARSQIRTSNEQGTGFALAGLVIGYVSIALVVGLVFIVGFLILGLTFTAL